MQFIPKKLDCVSNQYLKWVAATTSYYLFPLACVSEHYACTKHSLVLFSVSYSQMFPSIYSKGPLSTKANVQTAQTHSFPQQAMPRVNKCLLNPSNV
mmetsp:Transcript_42486/g.72496  ORF Transcript_42486/g.72496 Transcript_42486/m.72496 type:complete len:97 (+) Transcript_42486:44-334(+)